MPHDLVEGHLSMSVNDLRRIGVIRKREGEESWWGAVPGCRGVVTAVFLIRQDRLHVLVNKELAATVEIEWTRCAYGGQRPWFLCPGCGTRRAKLHFVRDEWTCRTCSNLRYESQRKRLPERRLDRAERIRRQVLGQQGRIVVLDPPPPRPKGMKRRRYWTLYRQVYADEAAYLRYCHESAMRNLAWAAGVRARAEASRRAAARRLARERDVRRRAAITGSR